MEQIQPTGDDRALDGCVYCGKTPTTRDHVPSKVLLSRPFPKNLPVVPACDECNQGFSSDEAYLAALIECTVAGSTDPDDLTSPRIANLLRKQPLLRSRLTEAQQVDGDGMYFQTESGRVRNVILKLARGHAAFELHEPHVEEPQSLGFIPLESLSSGQRQSFETVHAQDVWPEIGSRAFLRASNGWPMGVGWITVEEGRYRYLADVASGLRIRLVLHEYLAAEVLWN